MPVQTCPQCGEPLQAVDLDGDTAPWLSPSCGRGWWNADLTPKARGSWDPAVRSHRDDDGTVATARLAEHDGRKAAKAADRAAKKAGG